MLLALVAASPWAFGCTESFYTFLLYTGVALLALVWAAHAAASGRFAYRSDLASVCLLGLVLLNVAQFVPLPESVVRALSPTAAEWHRTLRPDISEALPGEAASPRSTWVRLSIDPAGTQFFLAHALALFLAYSVTRNLIASKESFRRLAWVAFANGVALTVLAVGQATSGSRSKIYWEFDLPNQAFGPFVNKNHYPYYLHLCAGLGIGLMLAAARRVRGSEYYDEPNRPSWADGLRSPRVVGLLAGVAFMLASVPFSLSRGGVLALLAGVAAVIAVGRRRGAGGGRAFAALAVLAVAIGAWFGLGAVEQRMATLATTDADNRTDRWKQLFAVATHFPLTGTGGGTTARAEQAFRTDSALGPLIVNGANNEYLEALLEGGVIRLALTLGLAGAVLWAALNGSRVRRRRSAGPMLLGAGFGLVAVAAQSFVDFGLHIPAVALLAAVVAAQVVAANDSRNETEDTPVANLTGAAAYSAAALVAVAGVLVALSAWRAHQLERLKGAANAALRETIRGEPDPKRWENAANYLETATRVWPDDVEAWSRLAAVHLAAAESGAGGDHLAAGLRAARTARDRCALIPGPHLRLGTFAAGFEKSEPPAAHFARAKRVAGFDPDVWYLSGAAALKGGDLDAAWADWRESLARSPARLQPIAEQASRHLSAEQVRARVFPDDPEAWAAAAAFAEGEAKAVWLRAAIERWKKSAPERESGWLAWGSAHEQLGQPDEVLKVWRRAAGEFSESVRLRDRLAARLEAEELYAEAIPHLEWLFLRDPHSAALRDRLAAARHAEQLRRDIDAP